MRLQNKVALLAGVGKGMGSAMARLFAQEGAQVALVARTRENVQTLAREITARGGVARAFGADVTDRAQIEEVIARVVGEFGALDIYIALAGGGFRHEKNLDAMDEEFFDRLQANHLKSIFYGVRAALPHLKKSHGAILTISAGYKTRRDGNVAYGTAKEGVIGLTRNLARELQPDNVRVNCLCPGLIRLPLAPGEIKLPPRDLARKGSPEDIAYAALYLVSDEAAWVTGQTFVVDGGDEILVGQQRGV
jgi:NAD(P)-dependent dehydrogenase (short-subunit alcohol dehydrogenase family)